MVNLACGFPVAISVFAGLGGGGDTVAVYDVADWGEHLGHVYPMPSLILWGDKDPVLGPAWLEGIESCFSDVRIEHHSEAGHFIGEEVPDWCAGHINTFLE